MESALTLLTAPLALLNLKITAPLLVAILYYPEKLASVAPANVYTFITNPLFVRALKALVGFKVVTGTNKWLSERVLNNWRGDNKFIKNEELVLISGGSSGIGAGMAKEFAKMGTKVVIVDLNPPKEQLPSGIYFFRMDVTKPAEIAEVAKEIRKAHGSPTVLINNAGVGFGALILGGEYGNGTEAAVRKTFEVNTLAHFWMAKEFVPAMVKKNKGHIVTVASMSSFVVPPGMVDYACTKASAVAFHEGLAGELKARYGAPNVKTSIIHPSWIRTPLIEPLLERQKLKALESDYVASEVAKHVVRGRSGQVLLPYNLGPVAGLRAWPFWLAESVRNDQAKVFDFEDAKTADFNAMAEQAHKDNVKV